MNAAAVEVVKQFTDIVVAYGQSDEYSFVLHEDCQLFERRAAKLATSISTAFSVEYCMQWDKCFPGQALERPFPTFDGRCVLYPKKKILRDYLSWRQADCESCLRPEVCKGSLLLIKCDRPCQQPLQHDVLEYGQRKSSYGNASHDTH